MTAKQIADDWVLCGQNLVIAELMQADESLYDRIANTEELEDVLEWWLVTPFLADMLKEHGEVILSDYDCHWWGRTTSGQSIYMDYVIQRIAEETEA